MSLLAPQRTRERTLLPPTDTLLLLLLAASDPDADGEFMDITRLMKLLFLAGQETSFRDTENFEFRKSPYGPFPLAVYSALASLRDADLLVAEQQKTPDFYQTLELSALTPESRDLVSKAWGMLDIREGPIPVWPLTLTPQGREKAEAIRSSLPPSRWWELAELNRQYAHRPLSEIIAYIYERHPEYVEDPSPSELPASEGLAHAV